jgi:hypothetical protein
MIVPRLCRNTEDLTVMTAKDWIELMAEYAFYLATIYV